MFLKKNLWLLTIALSLFILGCSDDGDDNPANGNPSDYEADATANTSEGGLKYMYGACSYDEDDNETFIFLASNASLFSDQSYLSDYVGIYFEGQGTGTYNLEDENLIIAIGSNIYICESGTLNITEYGPIGGNVSGNLTAELIGFTGGNLTVSNLSFTVKRFSDDDFDDDDYTDDDDNDDDNDGNIKDISIQLKDGVTGETINYSFSEIYSTTLTYIQAGLNMLSFQIDGMTTENQPLMISGTISGIEYGTEQFEVTEQTGAVFLNIDNNAYILENGIIKVDDWGSIGEYFDFEFEGTFTSVINEKNDLEIIDVSFELKRDS